MPEPIRRTTARVLPVNAQGEVLLLQDQDPARPGVLRWGSIGGATDERESLVDAALRELREETGILAVPSALTEPFLRSTYDFSWGGTAYRSDATFFAMWLDRDVEVTFEHLEEAEVGNVLAAQWWLPSDLEREGGAVSDDLPDIMSAAVHAVREDAS